MIRTCLLLLLLCTTSMSCRYSCDKARHPRGAKLSPVCSTVSPSCHHIHEVGQGISKHWLSERTFEIHHHAQKVIPLHSSRSGCTFVPFQITKARSSMEFPKVINGISKESCWQNKVSSTHVSLWLWRMNIFPCWSIYPQRLILPIPAQWLKLLASWPIWVLKWNGWVYWLATCDPLIALASCLRGW